MEIQVFWCALSRSSSAESRSLNCQDTKLTDTVLTTDTRELELVSEFTWQYFATENMHMLWFYSTKSTDSLHAGVLCFGAFGVQMQEKRCFEPNFCSLVLPRLEKASTNIRINITTKQNDVFALLFCCGSCALELRVWTHL